MRRTSCIFSIALIASLLACSEKEFNFESLQGKRDYSLELATDVVIEYSDSSVIRVRIEGDLLKRYVYRFRVEEEFPEGVDVEFYDLNGQANAWLNAKYAVRKPNEKLMIARDSVVLYNNIGEKIFAPELIWDEKTGQMYTDRFVKIFRPPDETIFSRGFRTNQSFTEYELFAVKGDMLMEDFEN